MNENIEEIKVIKEYKFIKIIEKSTREDRIKKFGFNLQFEVTYEDNTKEFRNEQFFWKWDLTKFTIETICKLIKDKNKLEELQLKYKK